MASITISDPFFEPCESPTAAPKVTFSIRNSSTSSGGYALRPLSDGYQYDSGTLEQHTIGPMTTKTHTFSFRRDGLIKGMFFRNSSNIKQAPETKRFFLPECDCGTLLMSAFLGECSASNGESHQLVKFFIQNNSNNTIERDFVSGIPGASPGLVSIGPNTSKVIIIDYVPGTYTAILKGRTLGLCEPKLVLNIQDCLCKNVFATVRSISECQPDGTRLVKLETVNPTANAVTIRWKFDQNNNNSYQAIPSTLQPGDVHNTTQPYQGGSYVAQLFIENAQCGPINVNVNVPACAPPPPPPTNVDCDKLIIGSDVLECLNGTPQVKLFVMNQSNAAVTAKWDWLGNGTSIGPDFSIPAGQMVEKVHGYAPGNYFPKLIAGTCQKSTVLVVPTGLCTAACSDPSIESFVVSPSSECNNGQRQVTIRPAITNFSAITRLHWTINNQQEIDWQPGQGGNANGSITIQLNAPGTGSSTHLINLVAFTGECFTSHSEEIAVQGCNGACPELGPISVEEGDCNPDGSRSVRLGTTFRNGEGGSVEWTLTNAAGEQIPISDRDTSVVVDLSAGNHQVVARSTALAGCNPSEVSSSFIVNQCVPVEQQDKKCGSGLVWAAVVSMVIGILTLALKNCLGPSNTGWMEILGWSLVGAYALLMIIWMLASLFSKCELDWCDAIGIHIKGLAFMLAIFYIIKAFGCFWSGATTLKDIFVGITVAGAAACQLGLPEIIRNEQNRNRSGRLPENA